MSFFIIPRLSLSRSIIFRAVLICAFIFLFVFSGFTQEKNRPDIFIAPLVEVIGYSGSGFAIGCGMAVGAEISGYGVGLRYLYSTESDVSTMETNAFIRFYFIDKFQHEGIFLQINGGAALSSLEDYNIATFAGGLSAGWRFVFSKKYFFVEPAVRTGYPYKVGVGVSAGVRY